MEEMRHQRTAMSVAGGDESETNEGPEPQNLRVAVEEYEKQLLLDALHKNLGHRSKTADMLGIDRKTLYTKLKKYGVI